MSNLFGRLSLKFSRLAARKLACRWLSLDRQPGVVSFSFDDVAASACRVGAEILERHGGRATFFICGGLTGLEEQGHRCHDVDDLQHLQDKGHEIGCHTFSHLNCVQTPLAQLEADWNRNRDFFHQHQLALQGFAFPFGAYAYGAKRAASRRFAYARITGGGSQHGRADLNALRAQALYAASTPVEQIQALIAETRASGGWLIIYSHEVTPEPGPWGTTPEQLETCVKAAAEAGCHLLPLNEAIAFFRQR